MIALDGTPVCGGVVSGRIFLCRRPLFKFTQYTVTDICAETQRFLRARDIAAGQLEAVYAKALANIGQKAAEIFAVHQMLLYDSVYTDAVSLIIADKNINAEAAIEIAVENLIRTFKELDDAYMCERAADLEDISGRVLAVLSGAQKEIPMPKTPSVLFAEEFLPSEIVLLHGENTLGFAVENASTTSHAALLARDMQIPMLAGVNGLMQQEYNGKQAILNACAGKIYIAPAEEDIEEILRRTAMRAG